MRRVSGPWRRNRASPDRRSPIRRGIEHIGYLQSLAAARFFAVTPKDPSGSSAFDRRHEYRAGVGLKLIALGSGAPPCVAQFDGVRVDNPGSYCDGVADLAMRPAVFSMALCALHSAQGGLDYIHRVLIGHFSGISRRRDSRTCRGRRRRGESRLNRADAGHRRAVEAARRAEEELGEIEGAAVEIAADQVRIVALQRGGQSTLRARMRRGNRARNARPGPRWRRHIRSASRWARGSRPRRCACRRGRAWGRTGWAAPAGRRARPGGATSHARSPRACRPGARCRRERSRGRARGWGRRAPNPP